MSLGRAGSWEVKEIGGGGEAARKVTSNKIRTSKYTLLTFPFLNLWEQMQKKANVYFVLMVVMMYTGEKTCLYVASLKAWSTAGMLGMMMSLSAVVAAVDDVARHRMDRAVNERSVLKTDGNKATWASVLPGDTVRLKKDEEAPADILVYKTENSKDDCNFTVSTLNLDGETNLKPKVAWKAAAGSTGANRVSVEAPTKDIYKLNGTVKHGSGPEIPFTVDNVILRGTMLRHTKSVEGVVLYVGSETRILMNSQAVPIKIPNLERIVNNIMKLAVFMQFLMTLVTVGFYTLRKDQYEAWLYLYPGGYQPVTCLPESVSYLFTFFVLYSNVMPISLYATIEVMNMMFTIFIKSDPGMICPDPAGNEGAKALPLARASNLAHELGQIEHVFSDKTGTLTKNVMHLQKVCVKEKEYTNSVSLPDSEDARHFLRILLICHSVTMSEEDELEAESPDEEAFLVYCRESKNGKFLGRSGGGSKIEIEVFNKKEIWQVLATNAFDSERKRMSILAQGPENQIVLFAKGADTTMSQGKGLGELGKTIEGFSRLGLRSLVLGVKTFNGVSDVQAWLDKVKKAKASVIERESALKKLASEIEDDFAIVGATAIEDELQTDVAETIVHIRDAGIKFWVLTGDNHLTAETIGFSTRVLDPRMDIHRFCDTKFIDEHWDVASETATKNARPEATKKSALIITGACLAGLSQKQKETKLLTLALSCAVVIACRISPAQKAELVRLVRKGNCRKEGPVTLAIGDGANDCPMIMEAQVGVGLYGREGRQAINSADFAIGEFRFLENLLLIHGRWNYKRCAKVVLLTFWRNAVQELMMCYYVFMSGYSGTPLFEDKIRITFNFLCTIPVVAMGVFDQDVSSKQALSRPDLYEAGRLGKDLNVTAMAKNLADALLVSVLLFATVLLASDGLALNGVGDYYSVCVTAYTLLIVACAGKCALLTVTWNVGVVTSHAASLLLYLLFLAVYNRNATHLGGTGAHVLGAAMPYVCVLGGLSIFAVYGALSHSALTSAAQWEDRTPTDEEDRTPTDEETGHQPSSGSIERNLGEDKIWLRVRQQKLPQRNFDMRRPNNGTKVSVVLSLILIILGLSVYVSADARWLTEIPYDGSTSGQTRLDVDLPLERALSEVHIYYVVDPIYQNHNAILQNKSLLLETTIFEDSFLFYGFSGHSVGTPLKVDFDNVAWSEDVDGLAAVSPLYDSLPPDEKIKRAVWARPSAFGRAIKKYGHVDLRKGGYHPKKLHAVINHTASAHLKGIGRGLILTEKGHLYGFPLATYFLGVGALGLISARVRDLRVNADHLRRGGSDGAPLLQHE